MFGRLGVIVCFDEESFDTAFDVLAYVAGLCERIAIAYCKGNVEFLAQSSGSSPYQ